MSRPPRELEGVDAPFAACAPGRISQPLRSYSLRETIQQFRVQTMAHHARSVYFGIGEDGYHYFGKGIGWCLDPGWEPSRGNTGILPMWAAERERNLSEALSALGWSVPTPVAIYRFDAIPPIQRTTPWVPADEVRDLDGSPAVPALYIYRHTQRFRLMDLPLLQGSQWRDFVRNSFWDILDNVGRSTARLHSLGGHDYSLSLHNVWVDGSRCDFECMVLPAFPHPTAVLNTDTNVWQSKEWAGLRAIAFELADLVGVEVDATTLNATVTGAHDRVVSGD